MLPTGFWTTNVSWSAMANVTTYLVYVTNVPNDPASYDMYAAAAVGAPIPVKPEWCLFGNWQHRLTCYLHGSQHNLLHKCLGQIGKCRW